MATARYRLVDVTPNGYSAYPVSINSEGMMLANAYNQRNEGVGLIWHSGSILEISSTAWEQCSWNAIGDDGTVVGQATVNGNDYACAWRNKACDFLDPPERGCSGWARDINKHGMIVGFHEKVPNGETNCTFWFDDRHTDFVPDFLPYEDAGDAIALGTNDRGIIVGSVADFGFIKDRNEYERICGPDEASVLPHAVNNNRVVVGRVWEESEEYAFRYDSNLESLGTIAGSYSQAYDVSDEGIIVGASSFKLGCNDLHGFVYTDRMYDLNERIDNLGNYVITSGKGINNNGVIAANSALEGQRRAVILMPI